MRRLLAITFTLLLSAASLGARELLVPSDFVTIQSATDASVPGDVIIVSPGYYRENIVVSVPGPLTIRSTDPTSDTVRDATVVDGRRLASTLAVAGGGQQLRLEGITLRGGESLFGGNVNGEGERVDLWRCAVLEGRATFGGGIALSPALSKSVLLGIMLPVWAEVCTRSRVGSLIPG